MCRPDLSQGARYGLYGPRSCEAHVSESILFQTPENPLPPGAEPGYFDAEDGRRIRYALFTAAAEPKKGTVILMSGRNESIEKYYETIGDLNARGFVVAMKDWRGQGGSARLLRDPARGHVGSFRHYVRDLDRFLRTCVEPRCPGPFYIFAHSTGGLIALLAAPALAGRIRRMVLSAPLLALQGFPVSMSTVRRISRLLRLAGLGRLYASGGPRRVQPFEGNKLTSDHLRYKRNTALVDAFPAIGLGGPTVAWVSRMCEAIDTVLSPDFMARIRIPILFVAAGADEVVSAPLIERYARGLRAGSVVTIDGARHEILQEADLYREQLLAAFDAFVPGSDEPNAA